MNKKIFLVTLLIFILTGSCLSVYANTDNEWVVDEPNVLTNKTKERIKTLNEKVFAAYKEKPQLGIMIINELPYGLTMDEYKLDMFNEYGVGTKEENHGMLFVFAIDDREYGFEIGDGFEKGSILRSDLERDFIDSDMISLLKEENYDAVINEVTTYLENLMADEENGIYAIKEKELAEKRAIEAEEAAIRQEKTLRTLKQVGLVGGIIAVIAFILKAIISVISSNMKKRKIAEILDNHYKHMSLLKTNKEEILEKLCVLIKNKDDMDNEVMKNLYSFYMAKQKDLLNSYKLSTGYGRYVNYLESQNTLQNFISFQLKDIESIVYEVDKQIEKENEIRSNNIKKVKEFVTVNKDRVENNAISLKTLEERILSYCSVKKVISDSELETAFCKELKALNFKYEYDEFIKEYKDDINPTYFESSNFYNELQHSNEYASYYYRKGYDRAWMKVMLFNHMHKNERRAKEEQARRERQERERRERARREAEERSRESSFGSSFGGGHSSGGGFSGGW